MGIICTEGESADSEIDERMQGLWKQKVLVIFVSVAINARMRE